MKKWIVAAAGILLVGILVGGSCGFAGMKLVQAIVNDKPEDFSRYYPVTAWCGRGLPFVSELKEMLWDTTYVVLLQNTTELRASGGFAGSYVRLKFERGGLAEMHVEDIYQPDGQLHGHVEPPYPIQEAFGQGWWKLRDANWDVNYPQAAEAVAWFMEHGGEDKVDGVIAVNLDLFKKWVGVLGGVKTVTYDQLVTADNLYQLAQHNAEVDWKPGSTQKRDFLGAVGVALVERSKNANPVEGLKLAHLMWKELRAGQMMVWFKDPAVQKLAEQKYWAGKIQRKAPDMVYVVESNLGANKANCCVERQVRHEVDTSSGWKERIQMEWVNHNPSANPHPPETWGGDYHNYVRVVVPAEMQIEEVKVGGKVLRLATGDDFALPASLRTGKSLDIYAIEEKGEWKMIGMWVITPAQQKETLELRYEREDGGKGYAVQVLRQPGIPFLPYTLMVNGQEIFSGQIEERERIFSLQ